MVNMVNIITAKHQHVRKCHCEHVSWCLHFAQSQYSLTETPACGLLFLTSRPIASGGKSVSSCSEQTNVEKVGRHREGRGAIII